MQFTHIAHTLSLLSLPPPYIWGYGYKHEDDNMWERSSSEIAFSAF